MRSEACGSCPAKSMCCTSSGSMNVLEVRDPVGTRPGEKVEIELQPQVLVRATALLYLLPAAAMVAGSTIGWLQLGSDLGAITGALGGLVTAFSFLYLQGRRHPSEKGPKIAKVLSARKSPDISRAYESHSF